MSSETNAATSFDARKVEIYVENHPHASVPDVLGRFDIDLTEKGVVEQIIADAGAGDDVDGDDRDGGESDREPHPEPDPDPQPGTEPDPAPEAPPEASEPRQDSTTSPDYSGNTVSDHYQRSRRVYEELGELCGDQTLAIADNTQWYRRRDNDDPETLVEWPKVGRCVTFGRDLEHVLEGVDRVLYATTSYNDAEYLRLWHPCRYNSQEGCLEWKTNGENPTPKLEHTTAIAAWGDIDLCDDLKAERGSLTDEQRETVEAALEAYIEEYAELYGSRDAVSALDSVGGAYVFGAPEATVPIAQVFRDDPEGKARVLSELIERSNSWLSEAEDRVNERVDGASDVLDPDWMNNPNRQYKAPLSLHADHDAVVTPIDTEDVRYDLTPVGDVDDDLLEDAEEWARSFATDDHASCVRSLVETLWPEEYADGDSWADALRSWLEAEREAERERQERREAVKQERQERISSLNTSISGQSLTPHRDDVFDAVDEVDIADLVRRHCEEWEPTGRSGHFNPGRRLWRDSKSGEGCFVNTSKNIFVETGEGGGKGGPAKFMALVRGIISSPDDDLAGEDYWRAVDALRDDGHDIPLWIPAAGSERADGGTYDETPYWAVRKAAVALNILPESGFVTKQGDDGGSYKAFPGAVTLDRTLDELEDLGIDHGWSRDRKSTNKEPTRAELGLESEPESRDEKLDQIILELKKSS